MNEPMTTRRLEALLREIPRRYRLPALPALPGSPSTSLAVIIETARRALEAGKPPDPALEPRFIEAMVALIHEAMQPNAGDPAFQAMVLRHHSAPVREYLELSAQQHRDRRRIHNLVNAVAHPGKLRRVAAGAMRDTLERLQQAATHSHWAAMLAAAELLETMPDIQSHPGPADMLTQLREEPALQRLRRLEGLLEHPEIQQYQHLLKLQGPAANSHAAATEGAAARQRGMDVETLAKQALQALADRLNRSDSLAGALPYRVVTAMYVPAAFPNRQEGAKTEWDAVLLRKAPEPAGGSAAPSWDVCLLVEAKASADAAGTDFMRLLRGLRLLAQAQADQVYLFKTREGVMPLRGASLQALPTEADPLHDWVLYCSTDSPDKEPRLLNAAARMQLLSAPQCLEFAGALAASGHADTRILTPLWAELLSAPAWQAVLHQYPAQRLARELMVHVDDLRQAGIS